MNNGLNLFSDEELLSEIENRKKLKKEKSKRVSKALVEDWKGQKNQLQFNIDELDKKIKNSTVVDNCTYCNGKGWIFASNYYGDPYFRTGDNGVETCVKCGGKGFIE